ncbi:fungal-specific transcription factor domain-containing protein [Mycena capillaripes]|nr:fungal-specific transcription factor domain-containing protein [Mycena capillaripes]
MFASKTRFEAEDSLTTHKRRACDMCRKRNIRETNIQEPSDAYSSDYVKTLKSRLEMAEIALRQAQSRDSADTWSRGIAALVKPFPLPHPDDSGFIDIADTFRALSLDNATPDPGFQGKSSAAMLVKVAVSARLTVLSHSRVCDPDRTEPKPWTLKPWETPPKDLPYSIFPDGPLRDSLVSLYFSHVNDFIPLLHRPTFEEGIKQQMHIHNRGFGTILILVCALGSFYSSSQDREMMGWGWYNEVELCGHSLRQQPTLYDLQAYCLAAQFLTHASEQRSAWCIVGFGLRLAQDIGAHRRGRATTMTLDAELEKRALWILLLFDTQLSGTFGRAAYLDPLEIDISMPAEWDDYGNIISGTGSQSSLTFFNCLLSLYRILHFTLRGLYTIPLARVQTNPLPDVPKIVAGLSSTLDQWLTSIPEHLLWHPNAPNPNSLFFDQSAALYCFYYYTRILIHRPLMLSVLSQSAIEAARPALEICASAARECIRVSPLFTAAMVLILTQWGNGQNHPVAGSGEDLALLHRSISVLKSQCARWPSSGFLLDVLERLLSLGNSASMASQFEYHGDVMFGVAKDLFAQFELVTATHRMVESGNTGSNASRDAQPREIVLPPVFVGDEEIPRAGARGLGRLI